MPTDAESDRQSFPECSVNAYPQPTCLIRRAGRAVVARVFDERG